MNYFKAILCLGFPSKSIWSWAEVGAGRSWGQAFQQLLVDPGGDRAQTQLRALRDGAWLTLRVPAYPCNVFPSSKSKISKMDIHLLIMTHWLVYQSL